MWEPNLNIPPHEPHHQVSQTWQFNQDVSCCWRCSRTCTCAANRSATRSIYPDGDREMLLDVPRYDFNWQHRYKLAEPKLVPAGIRLRCTAVYDNSADNPANPDPAAKVHTGTQSWDEMFNGYFDVVLADEDLTRPVPGMRPCGGWRGRSFGQEPAC